MTILLLYYDFNYYFTITILLLYYYYTITILLLYRVGLECDWSVTGVGLEWD
jgi:hypothetical protein